MSTPNSGYSANLPTDVLLDTGVLYISSDTPYGVTKGGLSFDPGVTRENIEFDGKYYDISTLDRTTGAKPVIKGKVIELNATKAPQLMPGSGTSTSTISSGVMTTITPKVAGELYATGDYLTMVRVAYRRGGGGYAIVKFPIALVIKWSIAPGGTKGEIDIEIEARQDPAAANTGVSSYVIELAPGIAGA